MKALKRYVERVVRPLHASDRRKDRMREELLAHLTRLCEEELPRAVDEVAAVAAATHRFGDAAALSRELQASVPWVERWAFLPLPGVSRLDRRADETPIAHLIRLTKSLAWVEFPLLALIVVYGTCFSPARFRGSAIAAAAPVLIPFVVQGTLFGWMLACDAIRRHLYRAPTPAAARRRVGRPVVLYTLLAVGLFGSSLAAAVALLGNLSPVYASRAWLIGMLIGAPLTAITVWESVITNRRLEEWGSLDLAAEPAA